VNPLISVVVCTHNRAELLASALRALQAQALDGSAFEVLVIDNNSSDATREVVAGFPGARYVFEPRVGLSHARNRGFAEARGEYVAYTDDDCEPPPQWLAVASEAIAEHAPEVFGGPYRAFYNSPKPAWFKDEYGSRDHGLVPRFLEAGETVPGNNMFFRRDLLEASGGFDPRLGMTGNRSAYAEETALQERIRSLRLDPRIYYDPRLYMHHLVRPEQMTLRWYLSACFGKGRSAYCAHLATTPPSGRLALLGRLVYTAGGALVDGLRGVARRDRQRYPWIQNHLWENTSRYIRALGVLWAAIREPRGSTPRLAEGR
jgi:glycosyltransferase involved in cell wall biosynthesis